MADCDYNFRLEILLLFSLKQRRLETHYHSVSLGVGVAEKPPTCSSPLAKYLPFA